jgi:ribokinase
LKEFSGLSILNGAPAMKLSDDVLQLPSIFCVNELESQELTDVEIKNLTDAKSSVEILKAKGCRMVIITLGKLGAVFNDENDKIVHVSTPENVKVVDTVGAGDAFIGSLAYYILKYENATWIQKIGAAIEIASHTVTKRGTQTSFVNFPDINPTLKKFTSQVL